MIGDYNPDGTGVAWFVLPPVGDDVAPGALRVYELYTAKDEYRMMLTIEVAGVRYDLPFKVFRALVDRQVKLDGLK